MAGHDFDVKIAIIGRANGLKGYVQLHLFLSSPKDLNTLNGLIFDKSSKTYEIKIISEKKSYYIAKIDGVGSRKQAEALRGTDLFIKRSSLPPTPLEDFYYVDLVDMEVFSEIGEYIGKVSNIENFGAGDLLEIDLINKKDSIYHPFNKIFVPEVDLINKKIIIKTASDVKID
ncbi:MAG: ribosome maturation factor RimM [Candidatus Midichloria sp.]|uniref:16S rRNA processing protein RimM n=1 Tax=Hyalomma marginatum TaxID=34627 RepID=A0A8S4C2U7_9ACAR|nr:16S rRNA processing protein RimM [Hyalomma marginatum]CAG7594437.1 16S rRNA processing protein RimM [Hyalomma marginatum]